MKRGVQILEKAKTYLLENKVSLLEQAITLINHALTHIQLKFSLSLLFSLSPSPSPSLKEKFVIFTISLNERLGRIKATLAFRSPIGSQISQSELTNIPMFYATAVSYKGSATFSDNRTNNGFAIV
jgi:hypothetical protein